MRDTKPEIALRRELHARGLRFRVAGKLPHLTRRSADIVWFGRRIAVFVDGCYWHGCPVHFVVPRSHPEWWVEKIRRNQARDLDTTAVLVAHDWTVVRIREHMPTRAAADVVQAVVARQTASQSTAEGWRQYEHQDFMVVGGVGSWLESSTADDARRFPGARDPGHPSSPG